MALATPAIELICTVKSKKMMTPTVFELAFDTDKPISFKAGQFVSIVIPGAGPKGRDLRRAYSIASTPEARPIELCIKLVEGPGTQYLYSLEPGKQFKAFAPYGDFVYKPMPDRYICFVATGTGVAPFRAMVLSELYRKAPPVGAYCFFGVRHEAEMLYADALSQVPGLKWVPAISRYSDSWSGFRGRVTEYMKILGPEFPWLNTEYYLCGNGDMITEVKQFLTEKTVAKSSIHQEVYYK